MKPKLPKQYIGVISSFKLYISAYGGLGDIFKSPYFHAAVLVTAFSYQGWLGNSGWEELILSAAPPFIAFSLGAAAIFNSIGDNSFRNMLLNYTEEGKSDSSYVAISAQLVHFIVVQTFALLLAIISANGPTKAYDTFFSNYPCSKIIGDSFVFAYKFFTYLTFIYGCFLVLATVMLIFNISRSISRNHQIDNAENTDI